MTPTEMEPHPTLHIPTEAELRDHEPAKLRSLLQQMLDVAENCDETGYATDAGFVDIDKLHAEVRAALKT